MAVAYSLQRPGRQMASDGQRNHFRHQESHRTADPLKEKNKEKQFKNSFFVHFSLAISLQKLYIYHR